MNLYASKYTVNSQKQAARHTEKQRERDRQTEKDKIEKGTHVGGGLW